VVVVVAAAAADLAASIRRRLLRSRRQCAAGAAGGRGGGRGGRGGGRGANAGADLSPVEHIWSLIGMNPPNVGGGRGVVVVAAALARGRSNNANTGDYLVTMSVNGQTYKQTFRVERVSGGGEVGNPFGIEDDQHDQSGHFVPKVRRRRASRVALSN